MNYEGKEGKRKGEKEERRKGARRTAGKDGLGSEEWSKRVKEEWNK